MKKLVRGKRIKFSDLKITDCFGVEVKLTVPTGEVDYTVFGLDLGSRLSLDFGHFSSS